MPMDRSKYPANWNDISWSVRNAAGWRCEGSPKYPDCRAEHRQPHPETGSEVILTVAHLDHNTWNNDPANLRAWCQRCHLAHDQEIHALHRKLHAAEKAGQLVLPGILDERTIIEEVRA